MVPVVDGIVGDVRASVARSHAPEQKKKKEKHSKFVVPDAHCMRCLQKYGEIADNKMPP